MTQPEFPEPAGTLAEPAELFQLYLRYYRAAVVAKCRSLPAAELRRTAVPSGWTPLELLHHLLHMEQRWYVWGFLGEPVPAPWGDSGGRPDGPWSVPDGDDRDVLDVLEERLAGIAARTEHVLREHRLDEVAAVGGRFATDPPTLGWICFHVLQEYARHAGHLDVVVELMGGPTGE